MKSQWQNPRKISERIYISADLELISPTHIGCGDAESLLDMPLARDPLSGDALLAGAALAGALKAYLIKCGKSEWAEMLFGTIDQKNSYESPLIVDDSYCKILSIEVRDGVAINPITRSADDKKKFDFELMPAGMNFNPVFELLVTTGKEFLVEALAFALKGLETGEINLGKRKRRGFGECKVRSWRVWRFAWNTQGMLNWLAFDAEAKKPHIEDKQIDQILLKKTLSDHSEDKRCVLIAKFQLESSVLIRSEVEKSGQGAFPDKQNLRRKRNGRDELIISGTSLAGVLRARARRISNTLGKDGARITQALFGDSPEGKNGKKAPRASASRLWVNEVVIEHPRQPLELVQSRVTIDRFTGGALDSRLFGEQPVYGDSETTLTMRVEIENSTHAEVGLLLLLLKDLWLGDLSLGGESSIGRGLLSPFSAELQFEGQTWKLELQGNGVQVSHGKVDRLQEFINVFTGGSK